MNAARNVYILGSSYEDARAWLMFNGKNQTWRYLSGDLASLRGLRGAVVHLTPRYFQNPNFRDFASVLVRMEDRGDIQIVRH